MLSPLYDKEEDEDEAELEALKNVCTPASDIGTVCVPTVTMFLTVSREISIPPFERKIPPPEEAEDDDRRKRPPLEPFPEPDIT